MRRDKHSKTLRVWLRRLQAIKTWQLVVVLLMSMLLAATFLRLNSLGMAERRSAVLKADENGNREATKAAVLDLQRYVSRHMNTDMGGGFYLSRTYERDRDAAIASASGASNPSSSVYQQASIECRAKWQGGVASFRNDYVQCVIDRVSALIPATDPSAGLKLPRADSYKINFASPLWTPDIAGFSTLFCFLIVFLILGRLVILVAIHSLLKRHYHSI